MFWSLKNKLMGILKKFIYILFFTYLIIYFEGSDYGKAWNDYFLNKEITFPKQGFIYFGLFIYSIIIEQININAVILPKINFEFILNKRHKIISCQFRDNEIGSFPKKVDISYEKNFDNIIGKIVKFFYEKLYFFVLEIKYPKSISLELNFLDKTYGTEVRKYTKEIIKELENKEYVHVKEKYTYYININEIGEDEEYENTYKCTILSKKSFSHSKIKINLGLYSRNKIGLLLYPITIILFFFLVNFHGTDIGITSEDGE